jgi:hypothetical protein
MLARSCEAGQGTKYHFVIAMCRAKTAESAAMLRHAWEFVVVH